MIDLKQYGYTETEKLPEGRLFCLATRSFLVGIF